MIEDVKQTRLTLPIGLRLLRRFNFPRKLGICEYLYGQRLAANGLCYTRCANGVDWILDLSDVGHRWMTYGYYEGGVGIGYAASKLKSGGVYLDSGANIGQWIAYLSQLPGVRTLAFEPVPDQREWLESCLAEYPSWKVEVIPLALGSSHDVLEIQCAGSRSTFHTQWYKADNNQVIEVEVQRLDSVLTSKGVNRISVWKLDVEGFEHEALVGAEQYLKDKKIGAIYFECHPLNFEKIRTFLNMCNYSIFRISEHGLVDVGMNFPSATENFVAEPS